MTLLKKIQKNSKMFKLFFNHSGMVLALSKVQNTLKNLFFIYFFKTEIVPLNRESRRENQDHVFFRGLLVGPDINTDATIVDEGKAQILPHKQLSPAQTYCLKCL